MAGLLWRSLAALIVLGGAAWANEPTTAPSRAARAPREFRFDALRIDGALRGPEVLVIRSGLGRDAGRPLHRRGRSFVHRIFETIEAPGLHGAGGAR